MPLPWAGTLRIALSAMLKRLLGAVALLNLGTPLSAQTAVDTAGATAAAVRDLGPRLVRRLTDSSGAAFRVLTDSQWTLRTFAAIRSAFPRTARPVIDSAHAVWFFIRLPVFRGDTVEFAAGWSQCRDTRAVIDPVQRHMNRGATELTLRFVRDTSGAWQRAGETVLILDGSCNRQSDSRRWFNAAGRRAMAGAPFRRPTLRGGSQVLGDEDCLPPHTRPHSYRRTFQATVLTVDS